mmetsp:Transcript_47233/g.112523  ORF Transcript_47233/g.112523 Transcript_47233/m.112523 type:complete len:197 (+) Transcript_47233:189-779(+)
MSDQAGEDFWSFGWLGCAQDRAGGFCQGARAVRPPPSREKAYADSAARGQVSLPRKRRTEILESPRGRSLPGKGQIEVVILAHSATLTDRVRVSLTLPATATVGQVCAMYTEELTVDDEFEGREPEFLLFRARCRLGQALNTPETADTIFLETLPDPPRGSTVTLHSYSGTSLPNSMPNSITSTPMASEAAASVED